ncbi:MAG TPA: menaquinone biosynthesis protein [Vicinamibacterales bacterium]|nr:menaquinone biosynthesis protein [Vicinamibacterales bacterium]
MRRPVRLGAVSYLNVRPLVYGLDARPDLVSLRFDVPSVCATLLAQGEIDLGMVPSISYLDRPADRIVPGVCIGSDGPVASVALFTKAPMAEVRSVAVDTSSRTSAMLLRILCARRFMIAPEWVAHEPDLDRMLARADAALLIGDPALFAKQERGVEKIDLGAAWTDLTGLPFVWAFWAGAPDAADREVVTLLQQAAATGMEHSDEVADAYCADVPERQALAREYLRRNLMFEFSSRALEGLETYYQEAALLGLTGPASQWRFF